MKWKTVERAVAACVFLYAAIIYLLTVAPTASFWDSGEFIAIANKLEVSHPPGAPIYMLIGRMFSMFVPQAYVAFAVNLVSVLASAFTVLFTHLIIVRLVREWQDVESEWSSTHRFVALTAGVIGAATFAVTDSFWFNAVEAEVYALSMFFTAAVIWLIMRWSEKARLEEIMLAGGQHPFGLAANRYLVLIAYLFGLAIGIHLLNLLAVFFIALIFFYNEFDKPEWSIPQRWTRIALCGVVSSLVFFLIYPGIVQYLPVLAEATGNLVLFMLLLGGAMAALMYYSHKKRWQVLNLAAVALTVVLIGYSSYALIFIRSAADPPIDENDPETTEAILSYLRREQYGATPHVSGNTFDNATQQINTNRTVSFPRRWSLDPNHWTIYRRYGSDGEFFWKYQVGHMYLRYFLWNFVGRASDLQDSPAITGLRPGEGAEFFFQTPSERAGHNVYFALPLLLGLIGALYHFNRDWRRAFAVLILFLITGLGIIVYLNQPPLQPRERDYSYVASFFAFSLWIGIGAGGILETLVGAGKRENVQRLAAALPAVAVLLFALVPGWMLYQNFDDHDRSGRYVAPDYAYNMLMSLEENAIVFTNGDNDTFPLWYLQEVEGVRTDVRVANLSLLNTPWYVRQLKTQQARASAPLPISLDDEEIEQIQVQGYEPRELCLPVDRNAVSFATDIGAARTDTTNVQSPMCWFLEGRDYPYDERINLLHAADQAALNMIVTNAQQGWQRPIYFAVTVSPDGQLDLQNYFQLEGQAFRIVPIKHDESQLGRVVPGITAERLKTFRFRRTNDPDVYFDENIRNMLDNYRNVFAHTAESLAEQGERETAIELLDMISEKLPFEVVPADERSFVLMARAYQTAGDLGKSIEMIKKMEPFVLHRLQYATSNREQDYLARFVQMIRFSYLEARDFEAGAQFSSRLADLLGDTSYVETVEDLEALMNAVDAAAFDSSETVVSDG